MEQLIERKFHQAFEDMGGEITAPDSIEQHRDIPLLKKELVQEFIKLFVKSINACEFRGRSWHTFKKQLRAFERELNLSLFRFSASKNCPVGGLELKQPIIDPRVAFLFYLDVGNTWGINAGEGKLPSFWELLYSN